MIARNGNKGFLAAHYEWLALGVGVVALGAGAVFYVMSLGVDPDQAAAAEAAQIDRMKPAETGVAPIDMTGLEAAAALMRKPVSVTEVSERMESFLASERRVLCKCGKAISGDIKAVPACPYCGEKQEEEKKVVLDADGDGLPDEWEKKYGLNVNDAADANGDLDGDEFTNLEEYAAKTDPTDPKDHPDYLDSLAVVLPLKETSMPFVLRKANKIPTGWRCEFFDPVRKDDYGRKGATLTAVIGEEIADTGFVLKGYEMKTEKRTIKGSEQTRNVDVSEATVERKRDGKQIKLVVQDGKSVKLAAVDVQATLRYSRGNEKTFDVVPGAEIALSGTKYKIVAIKAVGNGAKVTVEEIASRKTRVIEAP